MHLKTIYLSWRSNKGSKRRIIGLLERSNLKNEFRFKYIGKDWNEAKKEGFLSYPDFPDTDMRRIYKGNLKSVFSLRLMPESRPDRMRYLEFWQANNSNYDWFDELGFTQGKLATDNFEFLAEFPYDIKGIKFVTDLAGLSHSQLLPNDVMIGDIVTFQKEKNNLYDSEAIKVFKGSLFLGYIKKIHTRFFHAANPQRIIVSIFSIESNGKINQLYLKVEKT